MSAGRVTSAWVLETMRRVVDGQAVRVELGQYDQCLLAGKAVTPVVAIDAVLRHAGYEHVVIFDMVDGRRDLRAPSREVRAWLGQATGPTFNSDTTAGDDGELARSRAELERARTEAGSDLGYLTGDVRAVMDQARTILSDSPVPIAVIIDDAALMFQDSADPNVTQAIARLRRCVEDRQLHPGPSLANALVLLDGGGGSPLTSFRHAVLHVLPATRGDARERRAGWHAAIDAQGEMSPDDFDLSELGQIGDLPIAQMLPVLRDAAQHGIPAVDMPEALRRFEAGPFSRGWAAAGSELVTRVTDAARDALVGQDEAIERVASRLKRGVFGPRPHGTTRRPTAVLVLTGPSGTGKTELARTLARAGLGDASRLVRFDMNSFTDEASARRFIGSDPGYIGYGQGGELVNALIERPNGSVLLFDEFDKAHESLAQIFLQLIEEGRITDGMGRTADAGNSVLIFSTNYGVDTAPPDASREQLMQHYEQAIVEHFTDGGIGGLDQSVGKPFIGRLMEVGEIIGFAPLGRESIRAIARGASRRNADALGRDGFLVEADHEAIADHVVDAGIDDRKLADFGARVVGRVVDDAYEPVADYRMANPGSEGPVRLVVEGRRTVVVRAG